MLPFGAFLKFLFTLTSKSCHREMLKNIPLSHKPGTMAAISILIVWMFAGLIRRTSSIISPLWMQVENLYSYQTLGITGKCCWTVLTGITLDYKYVFGGVMLLYWKLLHLQKQVVVGTFLLWLCCCIVFWNLAVTGSGLSHTGLCSGIASVPLSEKWHADV